MLTCGFQDNWDSVYKEEAILHCLAGYSFFLVSVSWDLTFQNRWVTETRTKVEGKQNMMKYKRTLGRSSMSYSIPGGRD